MYVKKLFNSVIINIKKDLQKIYGRDNVQNEFTKLVNQSMLQILSIVLVGMLVSIFAKDVVVGGVIALCGGSMVLFFKLNWIKKDIKLKKTNMIKHLPMFINRMVLLIKCGVGLYRAFEMAVNYLEKGSELKKHLEKSLISSIREQGERRVFENIGVNAEIIEVARLSSLLVQNCKKGSGDVVHLLNLLSEQCLEKQRVEVKLIAERKAVLLLIPLMMLMIAVVIISVSPAIIMFRGGM